MRNIILILSSFLLLISCKSVSKVNDNTTVKIDTLVNDKISIRAITVSKDTVWYAANNSRVGYICLKNKAHFETVINPTLLTEYRSIAATTNSIFVLSVGNPAQLYKFSKDLKQKELVYSEEHEKVFYDSMQFFDDLNGIAIGDPIDNCFSIIVTNDGGKSWHKKRCENLPTVYEGEAAFAASNSNIVIKKQNVWIVSGGKKARIFHSKNKGNTWQVVETPIVQGEIMTGIFTADFYDEKLGIIAGGNYEKPNQNTQNKAITINGGNTWSLISEGSGFGYTSCIQFVPNSNGKKIVSVGANGLFYSNDKGKSWNNLLQDSNLYTIRFIDKNTAVATGKNKIIRIKF